MKKSRLIRLGALIDGEGTISIYGHGNRRNSKGGITRFKSACITLSNTKRSMVEEFQTAFGGSITNVRAKSGRKPQFTWKLTCKRAAETIRALLPYLVQKSEQARVALEFQKLQRTRECWSREPGTRQEHQDKRDALVRRIRELNFRGIAKTTRT